jgi:hypothetical protein
MPNNIEQTPTEVLDWSINWATRGLGEDTIVTSSWACSSPDVTLSDSSVNADGNLTTIFVTGGVAGQIYTLTNTVITNSDRTLQETVPYVCIFPRLA